MTSRKLGAIAAFALGVLWLPLTSDAQRSAKTTRIGYLTPSSQPAREEVFRRELGRLGHTEGPDFLIEYPRPAQSPRPPILIGGNGPRLLTLAAKEADIVGLSGITFRSGGAERDLTGWRAAGVQDRLRLIRETAGERFAQLELSALVQRVVVTDNRRAAAEELARRWASLTPEEILASPYALVGTIEQLVEDLLARRERWGISYYVVFEPYLDAFAPVVAKLGGK